ncbi:kinase-like domain-containing protein [Nemania abortiva]|nr:kinase-like domain-containing protein [Nemania abortiva]
MGSSPKTRLPDLVRDSKLDTTLNENNTTHIYFDQPNRRAVPRRETWTKERYIGRGGNGVVWLEKRLVGNPNKGNREQCRAVKQIVSAQAASVSQIYKHELEALAKFSSPKYLPWFVELFGWYESPGCLFIAMEYCPLGDLQRFLAKQTRLPESDTREIIHQVVSGLRFMHNEDFAHRDLKPGNILIKSCPPEGEWWVKISDMGLSKRIEGAEAGTTTVKGTPGFFAPEQLGFGGADPRKVDAFRTDIWCLGEMTFRMLCGEAAFLSFDDLRSYHQGFTMFPRERLHKIGASGPATSFITSTMLVEPCSRLEIRQASEHEWFEINVNNDSTAGRAHASHPDLGPTNSEPKCETYLGAEPSGSWSTSSHPLHPLETDATTQPSYGEEYQNDNITPQSSSSCHTAESDCEGAMSNSQTLRQSPIPQEDEHVISAESPSVSTHSRGRTGDQSETNRREESPTTIFRNQQESSSPRPITAIVTDALIIDDVEAGDAKEDGKSEHSIEPQPEELPEGMRKSVEIETYFDKDLQPRSLWYLSGLPSDFTSRRAEYHWLTVVAMNDILLKVDEIEVQGNTEIRTRRKRLVDRVNAMIDELELAKKRFDSQQGERHNVESREKSPEDSQEHIDPWDCLRPKFRANFAAAKENLKSSPDSDEDDVVYEPPPSRTSRATNEKKKYDARPIKIKPRDPQQHIRRRASAERIRVPRPRRIPIIEEDSGSSWDSDEDDVIYEPPPSRTHSANVGQGVKSGENIRSSEGLSTGYRFHRRTRQPKAPSIVARRDGMHPRKSQLPETVYSMDIFDWLEDVSPYIV